MKKQLKKKCVFVLEDNDDLRELFTYLLEDDNFEVKSYPNARSFRSAIKIETLPDVILLDIMLPDGNGIDICVELKMDREYANIPVIMMSAHMDKQQVKEKCDADDFIEKPFDINYFLQRVERLT